MPGTVPRGRSDAFTTLVEEPATAVALAVIVLLAVALDLGWKRTRDGRIPSR
jgi:hypothetical protein